MKTKVLGELIRLNTDELGDLEVTFKINNWRYINWIKSLEKKLYSITIEESRSQRSLEQNKYMWALIHEISQDDNSQSSDDWDIYCYLLQRAKAKCTYISVLEEAVEDVKKEVRALQVLKYHTNEKGKKFADCRIFLGSSKMNTKEMNTLIDCTLEYAERLGIDTEYYKEVMQ